MRSLWANFLTSFGLRNQHLFHRLHRNNFHLRFQGRTSMLFRTLDVLTDTCHCTPRTTATHKNINLTICIPPNLRSRRLPMDLRIGRIFKLLQHITITIQLLDNFLRLRESPRYGRLLGGQHNLRTKGHEHNTTFETHTLRHSEDAPVPTLTCDECEGNSSVSGCRFDKDCLAGGDDAFFFGFVDERASEAIFDAGTWSKGF
mmetsp:Transcript_2737/g.4122  ORF Transcript_2737/g.4122 Transcript_2737/m.4122 type:complete len:202 (-) Transcript_2737:170-775(-)